jgi:hypothetical protein
MMRGALVSLAILVASATPGAAPVRAQAPVQHLADLELCLRPGVEAHWPTARTVDVGGPFLHVYLPPGETIWIAIANSEQGYEGARAIALDLCARRGVGGVLHSDERFPTLRPGYWVAFSTFSSLQEVATQDAMELRAIGYTGAYPRQVVRRAY